MCDSFFCLAKRCVSGFFAGCALSRSFGVLFFVISAFVVDPVVAKQESALPPQQSWSFEAPFGVFDRAQLQRGFRVFKEVCSSCHSTSLLSFRNLAQPGGPEFSPEVVDFFASESLVEDGPDKNGEMFERPARPADRFPAPFANKAAAQAANNGVYPPDLSVIAKARHGGADYLFALLTGYGVDELQSEEGAEGMYHNMYFPGSWIAMPPPLSDGLVTYTDGSPETVDQYARDVTAFLVWVSEPHLEARHRMGFVTLAFLSIFAVLLFVSKSRLWGSIEH